MFGIEKMKMAVVEFVSASARYIEEYKIRDFKKNGNNWATAGKRIDLVIKMLEMLGNIQTLNGSPMSANAPYILNIGDVAEMVMFEMFNRLNGYGEKVHLSKSYAEADIYGSSGKPYEVKFLYSNKYRCTALNPDSPAEFVYLLTNKAVYKIPYSVALESEVVYGSDESKHRCISIKNIPNAEKYILKTYTAALFG